MLGLELVFGLSESWVDAVVWPDAACGDVTGSRGSHDVKKIWYGPTYPLTCARQGQG